MGVLQYLQGSSWVAAQVQSCQIAIRGGASVELERVETSHGPIVAGDPGKGVAIALSDPGSQEAD